MIHGRNDPPFPAVVHVIDDDAIARWMFEELLQGIDAKIRVFASAREFLADYRPVPCECLVCDLRMPEIDGLEVQRRLLDKGSHVPIILVSGHADVPHAVEAIKKGAFDFLEKPVDGALLVAKVKDALQRSQQLFAEYLARSAHEARLALLTAKEKQIAEFVAAGKSSPKIAQELGISVRTVENHRARLMEKLHAESVADLVRLFPQAGRT
ncbi:MAG: response regulator [Candidatus Accumulibacter sp.]|jgi:FixJ family two-component response regulator|nr:response regulator [Accumulibacter sp.]